MKSLTAAIQSSHKVFISYRREDSADVAGRIYDRLAGTLGKEAVFKDVDSIPLGVSFPSIVRNAVEQCGVVIAVIGKQWLCVTDEKGRLRLSDPNDLVRLEIETALKRGIPVLPLLVQNASFPARDSLPSTLRPLVDFNGRPVRSDPDFHRDMDAVMNAVGSLLASAPDREGTQVGEVPALPEPPSAADKPEAKKPRRTDKKRSHLWLRIGAGIIVVGGFCAWSRLPIPSWIYWLLIAIGLAASLFQVIGGIRAETTGLDPEGEDAR